jgi:anti-sigma factor RsiW
MMEHRDIRERLNDYAGNALSDGERTAVEDHLKDCADCRNEAAALRTLLDAAAALPRSLEPERDLWPGVKSRLAPAVRSRPGWTRFVRWEGLAAAAALAVIVTATLLVTHREPRTVEEGPVTTEPAVPFAVLDNAGRPQSATVARMIWALEEESLGAGKVLVAALRARPEALTDQGLTAIDEGLRTLDQAIDESAQALRADPENPRLVRQLTGYYRQRLSILRRATELAAHA